VPSKRRLLSASLAFVLLVPVPAHAFDGSQRLDLVAEAEPDQCFIDIGDSVAIGDDGSCADAGTPKTNQAYVWSLTSTGDDLWFGTGANVNCLVGGVFLGATSPNLVEDNYVCEYGSSGLPLPPALGDWRPPKIYQMNQGQQLTDISSRLNDLQRTFLNATVGLRAAGSINNLVYLAGPRLNGTSINIFVFDAETFALLEVRRFNDYSNIRNFRTYRGALYAGVANSGGGGSLLRFSGNEDNPLDIEEVLEIEDGEIAEFDFLDDQLYFGTWPNLGAENLVEAAVYQSPVFNLVEDFGTAEDQIQVWTASDYEPDPVIAKTYGIGALSKFDGQIYWGTMHVPLTSLAAKSNTYGAAGSPEEGVQDFLGTLRSSIVYMYQPTSEEPELLYGNPLLPECLPITPEFPEDGCSWTISPTNSIPTLGLSGFGNPFNNYIWSIAELNRQLYVGTMDWSYLIIPNLPPGIELSYFQLEAIVGPTLEQIQALIDAINTELNSEDPDLTTITDELTLLADLLEGIASFLPADSDAQINLLAIVADLVTAVIEIEGGLTIEEEQALIEDLLASTAAAEAFIEAVEPLLVQAAELSPPLSYGADLFRFSRDDEQPAEYLSVDGLENPMNYGIRTMQVQDGKLYLGTANPMNLRQDGGWELYELSRRRSAVGSSVSNVVTPAIPEPVITSTGSPAFAGEQARISGENLEGLELSMAGQSMTITSESATALTFTVPMVNPGVHKLSIKQTITGKTFEFDFVVKAKDVEPTPGKVNAGSFNGYLAVYVKGYKGSTLSWKIAGKWFKTTITKDFQVFQRKTSSAGLPVNVEVFIDGKRPAVYSSQVLTR
jgi:hypothetical protein